MSHRIGVALLAMAALAARLPASERIVVGAAPYPPFVVVREDGTLTGLDVDVVRALAAAGGFEVEHRPMGFQQLLDAVAAGEVDLGIGGIYRTPDRERRMLFTRPYVRTGLVAVERADRRGPPVPRIGVKRGATGEAVARRLLVRGDAASVVTFGTTGESLEALLAGRVDWVLNDYINSVVLLSERYSGRLALRRGRLLGYPRLLTRDRIAIAVSPRRPELAHRLDHTLARLERSGVLEEMRERWLHVPLPPDWPRLLRRGLPLVSFLAVFAALTVLWRRSGARLRLARRYHALLDSAPVPVLTVRGERVVWGNRRARELLGWDRESVVPLEVTQLVDPEDRPVLQRLLAGDHEGPPPVLRWHTRLGRRDLQAAATPAPGGGGEVQLALADVTREREVRRELERATAELTELVRFQEAVLDAPGPLIARVDPTGQILSWSRGAVELTGWDEESVRAMKAPWERLLPDPDTRARLLAALRERGPGGAERSLEARLRRRDGVTLQVLLFVASAEHGSRREGIVLGVDVTEPLKLRRELEHVRRMEAVGRFAGGLAHTFNNLLQVITAELDMAELKTGREHAAAANLRAIRSAVRRAAELTSALLTVARAQPMRKEPVAVAALLGDLGSALRPTLPRGVQLVLEVNGDPVIRADRRYLLDALLTLGLRARETMPDGGHLRVRGGTASGGRVRIEVVDTGPPPPEDDPDRLFDPFTTRDQLLDGSGLALASVRAVVEEHGGTIRAERAETGGTAFVIELPSAFGGRNGEP